METIYNYPGEFTGKKLSFKGLFSKMILLKRTIFLIPFRYYTLCSGFWCIWYVSEKPEGVEWTNDDWIQVEGEISTGFISHSMRTFLF